MDTWKGSEDVCKLNLQVAELGLEFHENKFTCETVLLHRTSEISFFVFWIVVGNIILVFLTELKVHGNTEKAQLRF